MNTQSLSSSCSSSSSSSAIVSKKPYNFAATAILFNRLPEELQDHIWDYLRTWQYAKTLIGHTEHVFSLGYSPDGTQLASGSADNTIKLWDPNIGQLIKTIDLRQTIDHQDNTKTIRNNYWTFALAYSPDGTQLASGTLLRDRDSIKLWHPQTGQLLKNICLEKIPYHDETISITNPQCLKNPYKLSYLKNDTQLILQAPSDDLRHMTHSTDTCRFLETMGAYQYGVKNPNGHSDFIYSFVYSPNSKQVATGSRDNLIKLWQKIPSEHEEVYNQAQRNIALKVILKERIQQ